MENIPVELHLLRSLKGPGLSVLIALWLVGTPQNMRWLQRTTGYGDEAVQGALELLAEYSLVARQGRYAWQITAHGKQLPLVMQVSPGQAAADSGKSGLLPTESGRLDGTPENPESDPGKSGVPCSSSSGCINLELFSEDQLQARVPDSGKSGVAELMAILDEHGIREPARSRLANLPHATPRLLNYHLFMAPSAALAIHRITANWRVPRDWEAFCLPADPAPSDEPEEPAPPESEAEKIFRSGLEILRKCAGGGEVAAIGGLRAVGFDGQVLVLAAADELRAAAARRYAHSLIAALNGRVERVEVRAQT